MPWLAWPRREIIGDPPRLIRTIPELATDGRLLSGVSFVIHRSVSRCRSWAVALGVLLALSTGTARAQYMYLDVNGDGVNTGDDVLTSTTAYDMRDGAVSAILGGSVGLNKIRNSTQARVRNASSLTTAASSGAGGSVTADDDSWITSTAGGAERVDRTASGPIADTCTAARSPAATQTTAALWPIAPASPAAHPRC